MTKQRNYMVNSPHLYSVFFAPRGNARMLQLGMQIAQQYLNPEDKLIGIIGEAGAGKSMLIKGMFPGLDLSNDDSGVNVRPLPILDVDEDEGFYAPHTYHMDVRFESAFTQMHVLAEATLKAIKKGRRVVVEHFDLLYPFLKMNAQLLIGIGEEVIITRPNLFGPLPQDLAENVHHSGPLIVKWHIPRKIWLNTACRRNFLRSVITEISKEDSPWVSKKNRILTFLH